MRLKFSLISILFTFVFFGFFTPKAAFADTLTLSGHIQNSSGNAISSATVSVNDTNNDNTTTDSSGNYSLAIPTGTYNIQVTPPSGSGFSSALAYSQNISANTTLNFVLTPSGTVTQIGHIYDAQHNPLPNQELDLLNSSGTTVATAITDSTGAYSLSTTPGTYTLFINNNNTPNYSTYSVSDYLQVRVNNYSLTKDSISDITYPLNKISVNTQDASGTPVSGVVLSTNNAGSTNTNIGGGITTATLTTGYSSSGPTSDNQGNATLWLTSASYVFTATPPTGSIFTTTSTSNTHITSSTTETIVMKQPVTLSGYIYDAQHNPLPNQELDLLNSSGATVATAITDSTGAYSVSAAPATYTLFINNNNTPDYSTYSVPNYLQVRVNNYSLTQNTTANIIYPLHKISVHIQDSAGNAISGASLSTNHGGSTNTNIGGGITTASLTTGYDSPGPTTDNQGNTTLWVTSASYKFTATPPSGSNYTSVTTANTSISSDTSETITLTQPVTLSGHIYDAQHTPLPNQGISLLNSSGATIATTSTDSTGAYSLTATSGTYTIYINNNNTPNYSTYSVSNYLQVRVDNYSLNQSTTADITYPLKQVSVHVQDPSGNSVSGVMLNANDGGSTNTNIGGGITTALLTTGYPSSGPTTNNQGNATLWLTSATYTFTAIPPTGSNYNTFTLNNISVTGNQNELVSLQYNHATPVTTANLATQYNDGTYSDPTTVTLSATAAASYTVANTYYTVDGGTQQTYSAPFTVSGNGSHTITYWSVDNSGAIEATNTKTFTIAARYNLTGTVYTDTNQNGFQDTGEAGYSGATVTLDSGQSTTTDSNGNYSFSGLPAGTYNETLTLPNGYSATTTNPASVALAADTTQNFGIAPASTLVTAINAGGSSTGSFAADTDYSGGTTYTSSASVDTSGVTNPAPQAVYQTVRYGNLSYTVPNLTPNTAYTLRLHFNEIYFGANGNSGGVGSRVFNVSVNGTQALTNFDIYQAAGGANKAVVEALPVTTDSNGNLTIQFASIVDNAMVNGIQVDSGSPATSPTPTPTPITSEAINAGGTATSSFLADIDSTGGQTYSSTASVDTSGVTNPAPEAVYQTVRYGNFSYNLTNFAPNSNHTVRLHFNEIYWGTDGSDATGKRVFNVSINGSQVLSNFDIFQTAGGANKAVVEEFPVTADANGKITIQFTTVTDNAMVNGIEVN
jgi:hypothetical protein